MKEGSKEYKYAKEFLKNSYLFKSLCSEAICEVLKESSYGIWKKGEFIDPSLTLKHLYIIINGSLKLLQINPKTGRSFTVFLLKSGDIYDFFTFLDGEEHNVEVVAVESVEYLKIDINKARQWVHRHPKFNETFLPYLGEKIRELEELSESMVFGDTATRLARLILKHTHKCEINGSYPVELINKLSHESLAEMIGSVRSVVTQQLKKLKEEGILVNQKRHLAVANLEKLIEKCDILQH